MKTKKLLVLILLLGLSLNAFSQEEVTIKQVIKNSSTNAASYGDAIKVIKIWTKIPVTIRSGKENAIYLTGEMKDNEKDKLSSFCVLKNNVFEISSPYLFLDEESKAKDFSKFRITLELADNVYTYYLRGDNNVTISKDIITDGNGTFNLWANSQIIIEGEAKFEVLNIFAQENSKIRFNSINANGAILNMEKGSIIDLNGKVKEIEVMNQEEGAKIIGDYNATSFMAHNLAIQDDEYFSKSFVGRPKYKREPLKLDKEGNIINSKGDTISKSEDKDAEDTRFIKDTFAYSSLLEAIKTNEEDTISKGEDKDAEVSKVSKVVEGMGETGETKIWSPYPNLKVVLAASVGGLNWSDRVSKVDDLFSSPSNEYDLKGSMSYNIGLTLRYKLNKKIQFSTGLLFESNQFKFKNNVMMSNINGDKRLSYETNPAIDATSYLQALYINIPLGFQYNFYKDLSLNLSGIFGINFRTSSTGFQRTYDIPNMEITERWGTNYNNFKPIKFEVQAGIGWLGLDLYVKYALTPLFKDNTEREVYPFSVGLSTGI